MGIDAGQLRTLVVRPALKEIGLHTPAAENLVMGTAAQESNLRYIHQVKGPALGLFQMEPATYKDIWARWLSGHPDIAEKLRQLAGQPDSGVPDPEVMVWNLKFAAAMCRVFYRRIAEPLPQAGDVAGMASYWKRYYNTSLGKGKPEQFAKNYSLVDVA